MPVKTDSFPSSVLTLRLTALGACALSRHLEHFAESFLVSGDRRLVTTDLLLVVFQILLELLPQTLLHAGQTFRVGSLLRHDLLSQLRLPARTFQPDVNQSVSSLSEIQHVSNTTESTVRYGTV